MRFSILLYSVVLITAATSTRSSRNLTNSSDDLDVKQSSRKKPIHHALGCGPCKCPLPPVCAPGVSYLQDGCGCCRICARQLGEDCDVKNVCDYHKELYCDAETKVCKAKPGRPCNVGGRWYESGESFQPTCRATCSCINGDLGCVPTCKTPLTSPATLKCLHPKLVRRKGSCCGEWICPKGGKLGENMVLFDNEVKGHKSMKVTLRGSCMVQTTPWSPCSKSCGFGLSDRVTNDNEDCKLVKETRLCNLRPCSSDKSSSQKRSCRKTRRHKKRVQFSLSGCLSAATYRPKYCGYCGDKCCIPKSSRTVTIEFICHGSANTTSSFTKKMMMIRKCSCGECIHDNNIFSVSHNQLNGDTSRLTLK